MYKLAISTSGEYVSAAIFEEKLLASFVSKTNKGSTGILLNQINELFDISYDEDNDIDNDVIDKDKYYFMHQSYDGNGNETPYELLEEIFEGEGGLISNILGHLIRPEIGIL